MTLIIRKNIRFNNATKFCEAVEAGVKYEFDPALLEDLKPFFRPSSKSQPDTQHG